MTAWLIRLGRVIPLACLIAFLIGCGSNTKQADLVFINGAEPETLDPAIIIGQPEGRIANALFEGLLSFGPDGKPIPGVAKSWEISPDGKTYTFHLRSDARWSNGEPVTSEDFLNSWKRVLTPETASLYNYILFPITNAQAFAEGKIHDFSQVGIKVLNPQTLIVHLDHPTPYFLDLTAFVTYQPVPLSVIEKQGESWIKPSHIVSNGAYVLEDWRINDRIRLRKNPYYWNAANVALEVIDILPISKASTAFNFYAGGAADLVMDKGLTPPQLLDALKSRPDFHASPFLGIYFLRYNCSRPPFDDIRVRKAFSMAIDKSVITNKITRAGELPAKSFVPPGLANYESPEAVSFDPEQARQLLSEAGYPDGKGFPLITYLYSEGEMNEAIAIELQDMWLTHLGVRVNLVRQEWKVYLNSMNTIDYDICRSSWVGDYPDPMTFLDLFVKDGGNNRTGWADPHYDYLIEQAKETAHPAERLKLLYDAENILINKQAPLCPLFYYVGIQLYHPEKWGGIQPNLLDEHPLKAIYRK